MKSQRNPTAANALRRHFASGKIYGVTVEADKEVLPTLAIKAI